MRCRSTASRGPRRGCDARCSTAGTRRASARDQPRSRTARGRALKLARRRARHARFRSCLAELQHVFALIAHEYQDRGQALPKVAVTNAGRTAMGGPLPSHCMVDGKSARRCSSRFFDNSISRWRNSLGCADSANAPLADKIGGPWTVDPVMEHYGVEGRGFDAHQHFVRQRIGTGTLTSDSSNWPFARTSERS